MTYTARTNDAPSPPIAVVVRMAALQAAAAFASGRCIAGQDLKSTDVVKVAEAFERWLKGGPATD